MNQILLQKCLNIVSKYPRTALTIAYREGMNSQLPPVMTRERAREFADEEGLDDFVHGYNQCLQDMKAPQTKKECNRCHEVKNLEEFYKCSRYRDGRTGICKKCQSAPAKRAYCRKIMEADL